VLFTTFATWCTACRDEARELAVLKASEQGLTVIAIPVDRDDTAIAIDRWIDTHSPPWTVQWVEPKDREAMRAWASHALGYEAVPTTFIVGGNGSVEGVWSGAPTLSELRGTFGVH